MTRDPRQDPQPGDVLRIESVAGWFVIVVVAVSSIGVDYGLTCHMDGDMPRALMRGLSPPSWRETMAAATVLHPSGVTYDVSPALADPDDLSDGRWSGR